MDPPGREAYLAVSWLVVSVVVALGCGQFLSWRGRKDASRTKRYTKLAPPASLERFRKFRSETPAPAARTERRR